MTTTQLTEIAPSRIVRNGKYCWRVHVPELEDRASNNTDPYRSRLVLYENDKELHGHSLGDYVNNIGCGLYSHYGQNIYFSSTDNSSPKTNNRTYAYRFVEAEEHWANSWIRKVRTDLQYHLNLFSQILFISGKPLQPAHRILDFGCGAGDVVYALRDAGFDAYGFDVHPHMKLRTDEDRRFFFVSQSEDTKPTFFTIDKDKYSIETQVGSFDLVYSFSVMEHVQDHDAAFRQISKVLNDSGVALHLMPRKLQLYEPHIYVPFTSMWHPYPLLYFFALIGIRNTFQTGHTPKQVAQSNMEYCEKGLNYLSKKEVLEVAGRSFSKNDIIDALRAPALYRRLQYLFNPTGWINTEPLYVLRSFK